MKKLTALRQDRAQKLEAQKTLIEERKNADGKFSEDQKNRFDALTAEIERLNAEIKEEEEVVNAERNIAAMAGAAIQVPDQEERKIKAAASITRALRIVSAGGSLDGAEKEMHELGMAENRQAGVSAAENVRLSIPFSMLRATAQTVSEDGGNYGGQLVVDNAPRVQHQFAAKSQLEELGATRWSGLTGGDVPLPVAGKYDFSWLEETGTITPQKSQISGPALKAKRLAAAVDISNRLLSQSSVNVEGTIRSLLFGGYDRAIFMAAINGAGGLEPTGILNNAGVQLSATTVATAASRAMITELANLVEAANSTGQSLAYLMAPGLKDILQNAKVDAGSGLFLMNNQNELNGFKAASSTLVPDLAGNKVLIFGDMAQLFIGDWGSIDIVTDPYSASLNNSVRLVVNGHADVQMAQPAAFAVNKFMTA
jgi:HK97 family phage major capsid protein